jgi:hypothetical protein
MVAASAAVWVATGLGAEANTGSGGFGSNADGTEKTAGTVVSTKPQSVDLKLTSGQITFHAAKGAKEILGTIAQLAPQDPVTITWTQKSGRKWIQKIEGRGTVEGVVFARTDVWITVKPDSGAPQTLVFPWAGRSLEEIAKLDQNLMKRISRAKVGDKARLTWEISDAKRVVDVKYLSKNPAKKSPPKAGNPQKARPNQPPPRGL